MKSILVIFLIVVMPLAVSGATHEVTMAGLAFVPDTLTINEGDTILWINTTSIVHTTTSGVGGVPSGYWDSGLMSPNDSFYFHFDSADAFPYYCTPHWSLGMVGLITVEPLGVEEYEEPSSLAFDIGEAYPNPFKGVVRINYTLAAVGQVKVSIFNSSGQLIRTIADSSMPVGQHVASWDGRDMAGIRMTPGAYFVRLSFGNSAMQRKALLLE
jgi:plastocyanin